MHRLAIIGLLVAGTLMLVAGVNSAPTRATASSHREAPLISSDPSADNTDTYIFTSPDKPDTVTIVANYIPLEVGPGGPNFYRFGDGVLYSLQIDNSGSGKADIRYDFQFKTSVKNPDTFLYNTGPVTSIDDANLNVKQTYTVTRTDRTGSKMLADNLPVAPVNVGGLSFPNYDAVASQAVKSMSDGTTVFAGPRADPFFVDLGVFDLLNIRAPFLKTGSGYNILAGYNVHSIIMQVQKKLLTADGSVPNDPKQSTSIIGVWATASRKATTVLNGQGGSSGTGDWVQVSRLGNPLMNEVVIPVGQKDKWNASTPQQSIGVDVKSGGDPELAQLIHAIYGLTVPPQPATGGPARDDLAAVFLIGIPDLTKPVGGTPAEELRINLATPVAATPNRMGPIGGDFQGWPNGRRLGDDVIDIAEQAVAGAIYPLFHKDYKPDPLATQLSDGVDGPDRQFQATFPYLASPYSGDTGPFSHK